MTKFLVLDCYDAPGQAELAKVGMTKASTLYCNMLKRINPAFDVDCFDISLYEVDFDITPYDGVCWTGSNLFLSEDEPIANRHIELCRTLYEAGTPQFGSCWGAQLAAHVAGAKIGINPKGREFGISHDIKLTAKGKTHPMMAGKELVYNGFTSHRDMIIEAPAHVEVLSSNNACPYQAIAVKYLQGEFWATQYHPEYDYEELAALSLARKVGLLADGLYPNAEAIETMSRELVEFYYHPDRLHIADKYDMPYELVRFDERTTEVRNWIKVFFTR